MAGTMVVDITVRTGTGATGTTDTMGTTEMATEGSQVEQILQGAGPSLIGWPCSLLLDSRRRD